jgi:hypothetical protein
VLPLTDVETIVDLNQLYFDHQLLLMQTERATCPERRRRQRNGATLIAGRIGCMQRAMGASAAQGWSQAASLDRDRTGRPPSLLYGPLRGPHDWRTAARGDAA